MPLLIVSFIAAALRTKNSLGYWQFLDLLILLDDLKLLLLGILDDNFLLLGEGIEVTAQLAD